MRGNKFLLRRLAEFDRNAGDVSPCAIDLISRAIPKMYGTDNSVLLFGSRVNGRADAESDYDIYVLFNKNIEKKHELRTFYGSRIDIHICSVNALRLQLISEARSRFCFNVKTVSESVTVYDRASVGTLKLAARSIYTNPGTFMHWPLIKINFDSKLSGFFRERYDLESNLYYCELLQYCLRVLSIKFFGWFSRIDVMYDWLHAYDAAELDRLYLALSRANNNDPQQLYDVCQQLSNSMDCAKLSYKNISVSSNHEVRFYDSTGQAVAVQTAR